MNKRITEPLPKQYVAAKAIILDGGKALVLKQSDEAIVDGAGRYHPPGGIVEPGESLHQALTREITEETGLQVEIGDVLSVEEWHANIRGEECQFFGVFYACRLAGDAHIQLQTEEASAFAWVGLEDLPAADILEPSLSVIKKALTTRV